MQYFQYIYKKYFHNKISVQFATLILTTVFFLFIVTSIASIHHDRIKLHCNNKEQILAYSIYSHFPMHDCTNFLLVSNNNNGVTPLEFTLAILRGNGGTTEKRLNSDSTFLWHRSTWHCSSGRNHACPSTTGNWRVTFRM